jgi:hypothetical protein
MQGCVQPDWGYFEWTEQIISINPYKFKRDRRCQSANSGRLMTLLDLSPADFSTFSYVLNLKIDVVPKESRAVVIRRFSLNEAPLGLFGWNLRTWRKIHWSDESRFLRHVTDGRTRVWRHKNTAYTPKEHPANCPLRWRLSNGLGCISHDCKLDLVTPYKAT